MAGQSGLDEFVSYVTVAEINKSSELGLRCPADVSIAGFDSLEFTKFTDPSLTSVYQPGYQLGATAARLLLERVDGMRSAPKKMLLETELKRRNSVRPPPPPDMPEPGTAVESVKGRTTADVVAVAAQVQSATDSATSLGRSRPRAKLNHGWMPRMGFRTNRREAC